MNILISACLLGVKCRYDGKSKEYPQIKLLKDKHNLIPICPEVMGGRPTPRVVTEIQNGKAIDKDGIDQTKAFINGAIKSLEIAKEYGCTVAVLKSKSPSCGFGEIYDGTFSGTLVTGNGIAAAFFKESKISILNENNFMNFLVNERI